MRDAIEQLYHQESEGGRHLLHRSDDRLRHCAHHPVSTGAYAYLKVARGCDNRCIYCYTTARQSYCVHWRRCRAEHLVKQNAVFDWWITSYGTDLYGVRQLPELMRQICRIQGVEQVRFLYGYADGMTDELLTVMAEEPKIIPYIDLPIQHASDRILERMNRSDREEDLRNTFARIRRYLPDVVLRTTVMVGFPGETEADFATLCQFVKDIRFNHLGCFIFSPEGNAGISNGDTILHQ